MTADLESLRSWALLAGVPVGEERLAEILPDVVGLFQTIQSLREIDVTGHEMAVAFRVRAAGDG